MRTIISALVCIPVMFSAPFCATYYFASNGDDTRSAAQAQSESTPWKTIDKLNSLTLVPGDNVLLRRGDTFTGGIAIRQSGSSGQPITLGACGTGPLPIVNGAVAITGWRVHQGSVYVADYTGDQTTPVEQVFAGGKSLPISRFPDQGYLNMDSVIGMNSFYGSSMRGSTDWTGASIHMKTQRWSLDWRVIKTHSRTTGQITLDRNANYNLQKGWGYFINSSLAALDKAGEWYYDSTARKLYLWPLAGGTPNDITASVTPYGLNASSVNWVTVENITFAHHSSSGVRWSGSGIIIRNCSMEYPEAYGMDINITASRVENCAISHPNVCGMSLYGANNVIFGNSLTGIGMMWRLNRRGFGGGACTGRGLDFGGAGNTITGNRLDSIGYIGIGFSGVNSIITNNYVNRFCMTTDDGAGIYTWSDNFANPGSAGTVIRKNIVMNGMGAPEGAGASGGWAHGIYMDDRTHDIIIDSNTCINNELGIFLHNNRRHTASANVCWGNRDAQIQVQRDAIVDSTVFGNRIIDNYLYSTAESQATISQARHAANDSVLAHIKDNYECMESPFGVECMRNGITLWKQSFFDSQSVTIGGNKISNGSFDSSALAWGCWPSQYFILSVDSTMSPDRRCLRISYGGDPVNGSPIVFTNKTYALQKGLLYRLRFKARENHAGVMNLTARLSHTTYESVGLSRQVSLDTAWKQFELFFEADTTDPSCRVDFYPSKTDTLIWLDSVSLYQINSVGITKEIRSTCFYNDATTPRTFILDRDVWRDIPGTRGIRGDITVAPFLSRVLVKDSIGVIGVISTPQRSFANQSLKIIGANAGMIRIDFNLPAAERGTLEIRDLQGRKIRSFLASPLQAGHHSIVTRLPSSGTFIVRLRTAAQNCAVQTVYVK